LRIIALVFKLSVFILLFFSIVSFQKPEELSIGSKAPDFSMLSLNGDSVRLSNFKGSIVFVDFWASWCLPCRKQNQLINNIHEKYKRIARQHDMKIIFINVSLDTSKELWRVAISKDNLDTKRQVCDFAGWNSSIVKSYQLKKIPTSFLIDESGKIIAKDIWGDALTGKLDKIFDQLSN
jgi:thiol-disulfide isomerase/thioredoxin